MVVINTKFKTKSQYLKTLDIKLLLVSKIPNIIILKFGKGKVWIKASENK